MPDSRNNTIPNDVSLPVSMRFMDQHQDPNTTLKVKTVSFVVTTPDTVSLVHGDFAVRPVDGATGPFEVRVTYGDARLGGDTSVQVFAGSIVDAPGRERPSDLYVSGIVFTPGTPEPK